MCNETMGDCQKFVEKYLKIEWISMYCVNDSSCPIKDTYESHVCTPEEITQAHYDTGNLYLCPPSGKLFISNNFLYKPMWAFTHQVAPNYDIVTNRTEVETQVNNFAMARE